MPTATPNVKTDAAGFALRAIAASLGLFGVLRLSWVETHAVLPLTRLQAQIAGPVLIFAAVVARAQPRR